jgi:hypothetical protein
MIECVRVASVTSDGSWIPFSSQATPDRAAMSTYRISERFQAGTRREFEIAEIGTEAELNARVDRITMISFGARFMVGRRRHRSRAMVPAGYTRTSPGFLV